MNETSHVSLAAILPGTISSSATLCGSTSVGVEVLVTSSTSRLEATTTPVVVLVLPGIVGLLLAFLY